MTTTEYSPRARAERVIASGRACLTIFALVGVWFAPPDPEAFATQATQLLAGYCVYAVLVWVATRRGALATRRATAIQYGIDLAVAIVLTLLTRGSGSPFFLFFTFMLLSSFVRWQAWGAWTTGLVVTVTYLGVVTYDEVFYGNGIVDIYRFVVRLGFITVMTMVLGQLGSYQQRLYAELHQLAAWPRTAGQSLDDVLREALGYAARLLNAPIAVLIWLQDDGPGANIVVFRDGRLEHAQPASAVTDLVPVPQEVRSFLHVRRGGIRTVAFSDRPRDLSTAPLSADLVERYGADTVIAAALPERSHQGWLLLLNRAPRTITTDDVLLAEIVAADISASVEHWYLSQRARDAAVAEERLRVSRDLHDGVLQSLTGCRLNIAAAAATAEHASKEIAGQLRALERSLAQEQQELREVIQQLRGGRGAQVPTPLRDLCTRVERQWPVAVTLDPEADRLVPPALNASILLMVHEALANAVRHGRATRVRVSLAHRDDDLTITIEDDGHGFPFRGRLQGAELAAMKAGPRSLRERAELLGGTIAVTSGELGATVEVSVPMTRDTTYALTAR
jgi:signal transduction histidine kinase